jgi:hypothetical protein
MGWRGISGKKGYYDRALRRDDNLQTAARYTIANPFVRASLGGLAIIRWGMQSGFDPIRSRPVTPPKLLPYRPGHF